MKEQKRFRELREGLRYIQGLSVIHVNLVTIVIFFQKFTSEFESTFPSLPDEDPPGEEYPVDTETKVEDPHQEDPKEVYPLVSSKGGEGLRNCTVLSVYNHLRAV